MMTFRCVFHSFTHLFTVPHEFTSFSINLMNGKKTDEQLINSCGYVKLYQNCNIRTRMQCFSVYTDQIAMLFRQYCHQVILQACNVYSFVFYKGVGMLGYRFNIIMETIKGIVIYQTINVQNDTIYLILLISFKVFLWFSKVYFVNLRLWV